MILKRKNFSEKIEETQKEFSKIGAIKYKIKAIPRHLKRSIDIARTGTKLAKGVKELSPGEVKTVAAGFRAANTPGTKAAKKMEKKLPKSYIEAYSKGWGKVHSKGEGAKRVLTLHGPDYASPKDAAEIEESMRTLFGWK